MKMIGSAIDAICLLRNGTGIITWPCPSALKRTPTFSRRLLLRSLGNHSTTATSDAVSSKHRVNLCIIYPRNTTMLNFTDGDWTRNFSQSSPETLSPTLKHLANKFRAWFHLKQIQWLLLKLSKLRLKQARQWENASLSSCLSKWS